MATTPVAPAAAPVPASMPAPPPAGHGVAPAAAPLPLSVADTPAAAGDAAAVTAPIATAVAPAAPAPTDAPATAADHDDAGGGGGGGAGGGASGGAGADAGDGAADAPLPQPLPPPPAPAPAPAVLDAPAVPADVVAPISHKSGTFVYRAWSAAEDVALRAAVEAHGTRNWKAIALQLNTGRTHVQCKDHWHTVLKRNKVGSKTFWTKEEDDIVREQVAAMGADRVKWPVVASKVGNRKPGDCRKRWYRHLDPAINNDPWTPEEDHRLFEAYKRLGRKWVALARECPGRTDDAVRTRLRSKELRQRFGEEELPLTALAVSKLVHPGLQMLMPAQGADKGKGVSVDVTGAGAAGAGAGAGVDADAGAAAPRAKRQRTVAASTKLPVATETLAPGVGVAGVSLEPQPLTSAGTDAGSGAGVPAPLAPAQPLAVDGSAAPVAHTSDADAGADASAPQAADNTDNTGDKKAATDAPDAGADARAGAGAGAGTGQAAASGLSLRPRRRRTRATDGEAATAILHLGGAFQC